jgi:hypothetical protein
MGERRLSARVLVVDDEPAGSAPGAAHRTLGMRSDGCLSDVALAVAEATARPWSSPISCPAPTG